MIKSLIMIFVWMVLLFVSYKFVKLNIFEIQRREEEEDSPRHMLYEKPED